MVLSIDRCDLRGDGSEQKRLSLAQASLAIQQGGLVAYATETFFALGCSVFDAKAVASVFALKGRAAHMALPIIVGNIEQLHMITVVVGDLEQKLITTFWPAPLSILFPANSRIPSIATGGTGMVAVRLSAHDGATTLAIASGVPLVSTSANISGCPAVTHAEDLDVDLFTGIEGYYDEGALPEGGLASTLVACEHGSLRILREGALARHDFQGAGFRVS